MMPTLPPDRSQATESPATTGGQIGAEAIGEVSSRIATWDSEIAKIDVEADRLRNNILNLRRQATDADRDWQKFAGDLHRLETRQENLKRSIDENRKKLEKAAKAKADAEKAKADAEATKDGGDPVKAETQQETAAAEETKEQKEQAAKEAKELEQAEKSIADAEQELKQIAIDVPPLMPLVATAKEKSDAVHQQIRMVQVELDSLAINRLALNQQIEAVLKESNQWVSFKDQIAPIFHQRCVACHNVRKPQGRYNMANFESILGQGESGNAITPGQADQSLLVQMIEDGSMPLDADPLSESEVALVRRWVDLGARIDIDADRNAPLFRMMPRVVHPEPPSTYPAAIPVTALAMNADETILASSGYHEVLLWSIEPDGNAKLKTRITNVAQRVHGLAFHPTENRLAVASGTPSQVGEVKLFDGDTGEMVADLLVSPDEMFDVSFSPDGKRLASCGADGSIAIFRKTDDDRWRSMIIEDHADWVHSVAWSPDASRIVSASRDKTSKVFDAETGKLMITFNGHGQNVSAAVFMPDGKRIASAGNDLKVRIWNVGDAKQERDIKAARSELAGVKHFGKDALISYSGDSTIRVHDVADGKILKSVDLPSENVWSLAITSDRQTLFVGDHSGQIHRALMGEKPAVTTSWPAVPQ